MSVESEGRRSRGRSRATFRDVLAVREFRGIVISQVASEAGDQIARVALALLVLAHTGSPLYAAATFAVAIIPSFLGGALLGPVADRFSRRSLMLGADLARAALIMLLALVAVPATPLWVLFGLLLVAELFTPLFDSARGATTPEVLGSVALVATGVALSRALSLANQAVGLVLGGLIVQLSNNPRLALAIDGFSFLVSYGVLVVFLKPRPSVLESTPSLPVLMRDLRRGFTLLMSDRSRRALVLLGWGMALPLVAPEAVALAYVDQQGAADTWGGVLMAAVVIGAAVGAVAVGRRSPRDQLDLVLPLAMMMSLPLLVTGIEPPLWLLTLLWFASGAAQAFLVPVMAFTTLLTPNDQRGSVVGIASAGFALLTSVGYLVVGWVATITSPAFAVVVMAVIGLVVASASYVVWPAAHLRADVGALEDRGV
ncbi:MAG TPA: MFS transporter [Candidatus Nanopelagicales bacterium]